MQVKAEELVQQLSGVVDSTLARAAVESYIEMQQRFLAGDWKPAELDGGRLCEAVSRCLLQLDTGTITHADLPGAIRQTLLDKNLHHRLGQKDREHVCKVIEVVYKLRSDRGSVHISPVHSANQMDSTLVLHAGKWMLSEFLRLGWNKDRTVIGEVISQLVQLEHSLIHELDGRPKVLVKGISAPDEVLLLLHNAAGNRLNRAQLRAYAEDQKAGTVNSAVTRLVKEKEVRLASDGDVALTPKGQKRVMEEIVPKYGSRK